MNKKILTIFTVLALMVGGASAFTTISVDNIEFETNGDSDGKFFSGDIFTISLIDQSSGVSAETIKATISESELEGATGENTDVNGQIEITTTGSSQELEYATGTSSFPNLYEIELISSEDSAFEGQTINGDTLQNSGGSVSNVRNKVDNPYSSGDIPENALGFINEQCGGGGFGEVGDGSYIIATGQYDLDLSEDWAVFCYTESTKKGEFYTIEAPDLNFQTTFEVSGDKLTESKTLSNNGIKQGETTDLGSHSKVTWNGNLESGEGTQQPTGQLAYHDTETNTWSIVSRADAEDYQDQFSGSSIDTNLDQFYNDHPEFGGDDSRRDTIEGNYDSLMFDAEELYNSGDSIWDIDSNYANNNADDTGTYTRPIDKVQYPQFTVYIQGAEFVTIEKITGQPNILDVDGSQSNPIKVYEGTGADFDFTGTNDASQGTAEFVGNVRQCSTGFEATGDSDRASVPAGEERTFTQNVQFGDDQNKPESGSCQVVLEDTSSGNSDTATVYLEGEQDNFCSPNTVTVEERNGNYVADVCNSQGSDAQTYTLCSSDEHHRPTGSQIDPNNPSSFECQDVNDDEEICGNGIDDDGDGKVDEGCGEDECGSMFGLGAVPDIQCEVNNLLDSLNSAKDMALLLVSGLAGLLGFSVMRNDVAPNTSLQEPTPTIMAVAIGIIVTVAVWSVISNPTFQLIVGLGVLGYILLKAIL